MGEEPEKLNQRSSSFWNLLSSPTKEKELSKNASASYSPVPGASTTKPSSPIIPAIHIISGEDSPSVIRKSGQSVHLISQEDQTIKEAMKKPEIEIEVLQNVYVAKALEASQSHLNSSSSADETSTTDNITIVENVNTIETKTIAGSESPKDKKARVPPNQLQATLSVSVSSRQRSKSFSGPAGSPREESETHNILPELTFTELRLLLLRSKTGLSDVDNNNDTVSSSTRTLKSLLVNYPPSPVSAKRSPLSRLKNIRSKNSHLKLPGEAYELEGLSQNSELSNSLSLFQDGGIRDIISASNSPNLNRPRLHSQPNFLIPDSIQTAPIAPSGSSAMKFFRPFRRASQVSTVSLSLNSKGMIET